MKKALIIGGSSGLGFELSKLITKEYEVFITGRRKPDDTLAHFISLDLCDHDNLSAHLDILVEKIGTIDTLIYAAGYFQGKTIGNCDDKGIEDMLTVGVKAPAMLLQRIIKKQSVLQNFIAITSTSQWTPRLIEPIYTASKAGLAMLSESVALDDAVGKVLVAGPAGMNTRFWENNPRDMSVMLDPHWVAERIIQEFSEDFSYKFIKILREPARVEVVDKK